MICVLHVTALEFYLVRMSRRRFASIIFSVTNVHVSCPYCTRKCLHIFTWTVPSAMAAKEKLIRGISVKLGEVGKGRGDAFVFCVMSIV